MRCQGRGAGLAWAAGVLVALASGRATAQTQTQAVVSGTQQLAFDRPESWALQYEASGTLLTGFGPPESTGGLGLKLGLEAGNLPSLSTAQRTVGFDGTKAEALNKIPVLVRPRLTVGLPGDVSLTVAWIPPVKLNGARPDLLSAAVGRPLYEGSVFRLGARLYGQVGSVQGDLTCSKAEAEAGSDLAANPLGCTEPSEDRAYLDYAGLELGGGAKLGPSGIEPHLAVAANYMFLEFDVHARYQGVIDETQLKTHGATASVTAGVGIPLPAGLKLALDGFYTPLTVSRPGQAKSVDGLLNARGLLEYTFF